MSRSECGRGTSGGTTLARARARARVDCTMWNAHHESTRLLQEVVDSPANPL